MLSNERPWQICIFSFCIFLSFSLVSIWVCQSLCWLYEIPIRNRVCKRFLVLNGRIRCDHSRQPQHGIQDKKEKRKINIVSRSGWLKAYLINCRSHEMHMNISKKWMTRWLLDCYFKRKDLLVFFTFIFVLHFHITFLRRVHFKCCSDSVPCHDSFYNEKKALEMFPLTNGK